jgi:hypothetical protein
MCFEARKMIKKYQGAKMEKNQSQKPKPQKSDFLVLDTGVSGLPRTDRVWVGFVI